MSTGAPRTGEEKSSPPLETPQESLLALAHGLDFARRYYSLVAASHASAPEAELLKPEIESALEATGRAFRWNHKERFYATREANTPGDLGLNVVEFILVARGPSGHFGPTFHGLAADLSERYAPELVPSPRYPRASYRSAADLRRVLADGLGLYAELAAAIRTSEDCALSVPGRAAAAAYEGARPRFSVTRTVSAGP